ncbi:uncharacterized protein V1510DRAFT_411183 [Dipodascopsis tothii]|uniref:uncharacterized protein n=1 Tax=Dipodascopsis tothii TaxID=44089 RepID=UPI0034CEEC8C
MVQKKVGVLGATGSVGQKFILLLSEHPDFELYKLGASSRSAGKKFADAVKWRQTATIPAKAQPLVVVECVASEFKDCDVVFSGLDSDVAGDVEKAFAEAGLVVISNAKNYRQDPQVPLVVPLVNTAHLDMVIERQAAATAAGKPKPGYIVCISNCSTAGLVVPLAALQASFGPLDSVFVTTMQAISGAGFSPGVAGFDILDNVIPYISGEEDKLETETQKILGSYQDGAFALQSDIRVSAQCNRVAVSDGHLACVSLKFVRQPAPSLDEVKACLAAFECEPQQLGCFSAPKHTMYVLEEPDRPQPRLDRSRDDGYAVSVGRVRPDNILDYKFVVLAHNTIIGAAGSGVLIAETLLAKGAL